MKNAARCAFGENGGKDTGRELEVRDSAKKNEGFRPRFLSCILLFGLGFER